MAESDYMITIIYSVSYLTNALINFDHGIIPACTQEMKRDLNIDDVELGTLGSAVYAGLVVGSIAGSAAFSVLKSKVIVFSAILCCILSLSLFLFTKSFYILLISRFLVGFFQIFLVVYFPVWIDFFAGNKKTLYLTFMQLGVALGAVAGYFVTSIFISYSGNWQQPYELQICLLTPCFLFFFFCSEHYLDTSGEKKEAHDLSYNTIVKQLLTNKLYLYTMMSLSTLFFVVNGMQFWISDYFRVILGVPQQIVFKAYMAVTLTAPIFGVAAGGALLHYTGGYDGEKALTISAIEAFLASFTGTIIPFIDDFAVVVVLLWLLLFFGGSIVPAVTGIMICSVPPAQRSIGNSFSHIFQELLGYLPSPVLYGLVQDLTGGPTSRWGMGLLILWSYFGLVFITLAQKEKIPKEEDEEEEYKPEIEIPLIDQQQQVPKFTDFRDLNSVSLANSGILFLPQNRSRQGSVDTSVGQPFRRLRRQNSMIDTVNVMANLVGRGSLMNGEVHELRQKRVNSHSSLT